MTSEATIFLAKLTRREFRQRMASGELAACIVPVAAIEQHLEHLALEHDWRSAQYVAACVAQRLRPRVLVAEALLAGISEHHMRHAGTLSLRPGTFLAVLEDLIDSLVRGGFRNLLILNGHGGNVAACQAVWEQILRRFQINLQFLSYWDVLTQDDARQLLDSGHELPIHLPGHAQEFETSFALAAFPENVRWDVCNQQPDPTPAMASAEKGLAMIERVVDRVTEYLQAMIDGRRTAEIPFFYP